MSRLNEATNESTNSNHSQDQKMNANIDQVRLPDYQWLFKHWWSTKVGPDFVQHEIYTQSEAIGVSSIYCRHASNWAWFCQCRVSTIRTTILRTKSRIFYTARRNQTLNVAQYHLLLRYRSTSSFTCRLSYRQLFPRKPPQPARWISVLIKVVPGTSGP